MATHSSVLAWRILGTEEPSGLPSMGSHRVGHDWSDLAAAGLPVHHQLPEFTQTLVHRVGDAIQPSHPLSSPFPPAPNPSRHQSLPMSQLSTWGGQSTGVSALASFLPMNTQGWPPLGWTGWTSLQPKEACVVSLWHHKCLQKLPRCLLGAKPSLVEDLFLEDHFSSCVLVPWSQGMPGPSSLPRDRTHTPCIGRQSHHHWTTRQVQRTLRQGI